MNLGRIWNFTSDNCAPRKAEHLHPSSFSIWMRKRSFKNFTTKKKKKELHYNLLLLLLSRFSRQPTRLHRPWDSPGNNTEVGCHFLLQCMKLKSESEVAQLCPTLWDPMDLQPTRLLCPWDFPGKSTGVGCHCLLHNLT